MSLVQHLTTFAVTMLFLFMELEFLVLQLVPITPQLFSIFPYNPHSDNGQL